MKKFLSTLVMAFLTTCTTFARWQPDDKEYKVVGEENSYGQVLLKTLRTDNGEIVLTWLQPGEGLLYGDPDFGYFLHMQIFDKDGKPRFNPQGVIVSNKPTQTWTYDYDVKLASNGDIIMAYWDVRNDAEAKSKNEIFLYRYDIEGKPVWSEDGIKVASVETRCKGNDISPCLAVSGDNIYLTYSHEETYKEESTEENWEPDPWQPDEKMPDSIEVSCANYQLLRINDDGTPAWKANDVKNLEMTTLYPAPDGDVYYAYFMDGYLLHTDRIDSDGNRKWTTLLEEDPLLGEWGYVDVPEFISDGNGGAVMTYRMLTEWAGYIVMNHIDAEGNSLGKGYNFREYTDGDGDVSKAAYRGGKVFCQWAFTSDNNEYQIYAGMLNLNGQPCWNGDKAYGFALESNDWGFSPVKTIAQDNGWVIFYGNMQSWAGANFMVVKLDDNGNTIWKKQIAEDDCEMNNMRIVNDDKYAYIFFTYENYDGTDTEGGLRCMCIDITDKTNCGSSTIFEVETENNPVNIYNLQGIRCDDMQGKGVYVVKQGNITRKVAK